MADLDQQAVNGAHNASKNTHVWALSQGKFGRTLLQGFSRRVEFDGEGFYDSIADVLGNIVKR
jgi:hypothetical protein